MFMTVKQASEKWVYLTEESEFFALRGRYREHIRRDEAGKSLLMP